MLGPTKLPLLFQLLESFFLKAIIVVFLFQGLESARELALLYFEKQMKCVSLIVSSLPPTSHLFTTNYFYYHHHARRTITATTTLATITITITTPFTWQLLSALLIILPRCMYS